MELILTCRQCGHREAGNTERALMTKIRMWNHLNHAHPALTDAFKQTVIATATSFIYSKI